MAARLPCRLGWLLPIALLLAMAMVHPSPAAQPPQSVSVAVGQDIPPFSFKDPQGRVTGWLIDLWKLWSHKTGIKVEFIAVPFAKTLQLVRTGQADIHGGCFYSESRAKYLDYVVPLATTDTTFFFEKNVFGLNGLKDLMGFRVGVMEGDYAVDYLRQHLPGVSLTEYPTYQAMRQALESGALRVFVADAPTGLFFLNQWNLIEQFRYYQGQPLYQGVFRAAVRKGNASLPPWIKQGMEQISSQEKAQIERRWAGMAQTKTEGVLRIACDSYMPPFSMLTPAGKPAGLLIDFWRLWASKTHKRIEFVFGDWADTLRLVQEGKAEIHSGLFRTPQREEFFSFSLPVYYTKDSFAFRNDRPPPSLEELAQAKVGVMAGSAEASWLAQKYPRMTLVYYKGFRQMFRALQAGEVRAVYAGGISLQNTLEKFGLLSDIRVGKLGGSVTPILAAVQRGHWSLLTLVNDGIRAISDQEMQAIEEQWVSDHDLRFFIAEGRHFELSPEEKAWLKKHSHITLGVAPHWMPLEGVSPEGVYQGISSGIIQLISQKLGVDMAPAPGLTWAQAVAKAEEGEIDLLPMATPAQLREKRLRFTRPYLNFPVVLITREDGPLVLDLAQLKGWVIAVPAGYAVAEMIQKDHPQLRLKLVRDVEEGLRQVADKKADAYLGNLASVNYNLKRLGLTGLRIALVTKYQVELAMGVRQDWPELAALVQKALYSLTAEEKAAISSEWINTRFAPRLDWGFIARAGGGTAAVVAIILAVIIIWNRRMAREVVQRKQAEERLAAMVANVPGAIFQMDIHPDGRRRYRYLSAQAEEFFGATPEEIIREKKLLPWHPEDQKRVSREIERAIGAGEAVNLVARIQPPGGGVKWVRITASPAREGQGGTLATGFILDVTARKLAELEYLASERKVKAMSQAVEDALIMIDGQDRVLFWNPAAERLFGYSEAEALGMRFHPMAAPEEYHEQIGHSLERFHRTGQGAVLGATTELTARNRQGQKFPVEVTLSAFRLDEQWYAVGTVRDISERKKVEQLLRESQSRLDMALSASNTGLWDWRPQEGEDYHNEQWYRQLGYTSAEFPPGSDPLIQLMHPDDAFQFKQAMESYLAGRDDAYKQEFRMKAKDGSWRWILSVGQVSERDEAGRVKRVIGVHLDLTERKTAEEALRESEERSRRILDSAGEGIFGVDGQGRITFVNPSAVHMLGYQEKELLGQLGHAMLHHHYADGSEYPLEECPMWASYSRGQPHHVEDEVMWRKDGVSFPAEYASTPIVKDGKVMGAVVTFRDITERKQAEEELRRNLDELERFNRLTVGRELRMIALKQEINDLLAKAGQGQKYRIVDQADMQ